MILLQQTLSLFPFLAGLTQLNLQAARKQDWGLLQSNSNAIIFTGKLTQDPISSMRAGRKEERDPGKPRQCSAPFFWYACPSFSWVMVGRVWDTSSRFPPCPGGVTHAAAWTNSADPGSRCMALGRLSLHRSSSETKSLCADTPCLWKLKRTWFRNPRKIRHFHLSLDKHLYEDVDSFQNRLSWLMAEFWEAISDLNLLLWWCKTLQNNSIHTVKQLFNNTAGMIIFTENVPLAGSTSQHL